MHSLGNVKYVVTALDFIKKLRTVSHSSNQLHPQEQWGHSDQRPKNLCIVKGTLLRSLFSAIYSDGIFGFQRHALGNEPVSPNYSCQKLGIHQAPSQVNGGRNRISRRQLTLQ